VTSAIVLGILLAATPPAQAPSFALTDLHGQKIELTAYRGHVVLLDFWATWCAPCRSEIPRLIDLQTKYRARGLRVIGISLDDDPAAVRAFDQEFKMNYPVVIGDAALAARYGRILGLPVMFVIDQDGRIRARYDGETDMRAIERAIAPLLKAK